MSTFPQSDNNTLLDYAIKVSDHDMVASSPDGYNQEGAIQLVISNGTGNTISVQSIQVQLPIGSGANYLSSDVSMNSAISPSDDWVLTSNGQGSYTIVPASGSSGLLSTNSIEFQVSGVTVSDVVGTFRIGITENIIPAITNQSQTNTGKFLIGKFPYEFYMNNFRASAVAVSNGQTVMLSWNGSENAAYTMLWSDSEGQQSADVSNVRSWQSPPLFQATTFMLVGQNHDNGGVGTKELSLNVMVTNPFISADYLNSKNGATFGSTTSTGQWDVTNVADSPNGLSGKWQIRDVWQSWTAGMDGTFTKLSVECLETGGELALYIRKGIGTSGMEVAGQSVVLTPTGWQDIELVHPFEQQVGHEYTWQLQAYPVPDKLPIITMNTNEFPDGSSGGTPALSSSQDFRFKTWVESTPGKEVVIKNNGMVGIGKQPTVALDVDGTVQATSVVQTSDMALKTQILPIPNALDKICAMRGVSFDWKRGNKGSNLGFIAQEVEKILPELVHLDGSGLKGIQYGNMTAVLVEAIKELRAENEALKARLDALEE